MYASELGGQGDFTEYNRSGNSRNGQDTAHANGANTEDGQPYSKKIDYVFFSTNRAGINNGDAQIQKDTSDHDMLTSSTMMDKR